MKTFTNIQRIFLAALLIIGWNALPAQLNLATSDTKVNTTTTNRQARPVTAQAGDGQNIIVWECQEKDGNGFGISAQRFTALGTTNGSEIQINTTATGDQRFPDVAMDDSGKSVVVWMDSEGNGTHWNIFARAFDAAGTQSAADFDVSSTTTGTHRAPAVAMDNDGDYVVVWANDQIDGDGFGIAARLFTNPGTAATSNIQVNDSASGFQGHPDVAMDANGNFVVVWQSQDGDGDGNGVFAKVYDNTGTATVAQFQVNTTTAGNQQEPAVAMDANGNFVVSWSSWDATNGVYQVLARRFASDGTAQSGEFSVSGSATEAHDHSHVAMTGEGSFIVSYSSYGVDGDYHGVYLQAYDNSGNANGTDTIVNTNTSNFQQFADIAWRLDSLNAIITWQSGLESSTATLDGDGYGIFTKMAGNVDSEAPVVVCQNLTVDLDASGSASITAQDVDNGSTDNVGITSMSIDVSSFSCSEIGVNLVTLTASDSAGNSASCTSNVTVQDVTAPSAVCQNLTVSLDATGSASITASQIDNGSSDNCSVASTSINTSNFSCTEVGNNTVTLTVTDGSGNSSTCDATVTVEDNTAPSVACSNVSAYLNSAGTASITTGDILSSISDNCGVASMSLDVTDFNCNDLGSNTVTLTATDDNGNSSTCTSTVTVIDSVAPMATCQNVTVALDANGSASITAADVTASSSDNCGVTGTTVSQASFGCTEIGNNIVTLTATDASGNNGTCTATVTVQDNIAPSAVCQNVTVSLDANGSATLDAFQIDNGSSDNCSIALYDASASSFSCTDLGNQTVTLTVTDDSGNSSSCTSTVTVQDNSGPSITCSNVTVSLNTSGTASIGITNILGSLSDNCSVSSTSLSKSSFSCSDLGSNTVTVTATDNNGNSSSCNATVTVQDVTAPTATCKNVTVTLNSSGAATISAASVTNSTSDNCGVSSTSVSQTNFDCGDVGNNTVSLTATDASGNNGVCTATVTVQDNINPTISCTPSLTYSCVANIPTVATGVTTSDNCDSNPIVTYTESANTALCGSGFHVRNRTYTVTDENGNESTCTQQLMATVPTKIVIGTNTFCIAKVRVFPNCVNPSSVQIKSSQKINKVTLVDQNGTWHNYTSVGGTDRTFTLASGLIVKKVWVKSGCSSTNGNGFTHTTNLCGGSKDDNFGPDSDDVNDLSFEEMLQVAAFPNPTSGQISVQLSLGTGSNENFQIQVIDMHGRLLQEKDGNLQGGFYETEFDLGEYANGLYYIVVDGNGQRLTQKVVKE